MQGSLFRPVIVLLSFLFLTNGAMYGQDKDPKDQFNKAFGMMLDQQYTKALPIWKSLLKKKPESPNLNYFVGACYHRSKDEKLKGIPYLEKAITKTTNNYNPKFKAKEAPTDAHFLLAELYHLDYQFKKAIEQTNQFKKKASEENIKGMPTDPDRLIAMCKRGQKMIHDPVEVKISNLGGNINSKYPEYCPAVNLDETTIYFTSRRLRPDSSNLGVTEGNTGEYFEDIYVSYKENGKWSEPKMLSINTEEHEATSNLSKDARKLFIYKDEIGTGNIYKSVRKGKKLTKPTKVGEHVNSDAYESHLDISADNDLLYFVSDREGGYGGKDIYSVRKLPTGDWAKPKNLGPTVNTKYDEDGPFIHPDGKTLYFSSKGHSTMGGFDVFTTQLKEDNRSWTEPKNIGYPVNSPDDDIYFVTTPDGKRAYYSSDFKGLKTKQTGKIKGYGGSDIYLLTFPGAEEKNLTLLKGFIHPGNCKDLLADIFIMVTNKNTGEMVQQLVPRTRDGGYVSILPPGNTYRITYMHKDKVFYSEQLQVSETSAYQEINRAVNLDTLNFDCSTGEIMLASKMDEEEEDKDGSGDKDGEDGDKDEKGSMTEEEIGALVAKANYQREFGYNKNKIATRKKEFSSFVEKIETLAANMEGKVKVSIEASASRVPTTTYKTNQNLARVRAENAKKSLKEALEDAGVDPERIEFTKVEQLVQGPVYNNDPENKEKYGKYQYVKMKVVE